jgi:hypothetical protein
LVGGELAPPSCRMSAQEKRRPLLKPPEIISMNLRI